MQRVSPGFSDKSIPTEFIFIEVHSSNYLLYISCSSFSSPTRLRPSCQSSPAVTRPPATRGRAGGSADLITSVSCIVLILSLSYCHDDLLTCHVHIIMSGNTWYEEIGGCPWYHHWYPLQLLRNIVRDQADMQAMFDNVRFCMERSAP